MKTIRNILKRSIILRGITRGLYAFKYVTPQLGAILKWVFFSRESHTFTYNLTSPNRKYLIQTVSLVTGQPYEVIEGYFSEAENSVVLKDYVIRKMKDSKDLYKKDLRCD